MQCKGQASVTGGETEAGKLAGWPFVTNFALIKNTLQKKQDMNNQTENRKLRICLWLVRMLQRHKALTLEEIRELWSRSEFYSEGQTILYRKAFVIYRNTAEELLHLRIECDRRTNKYSLADKDDSKLSDWLISSFSIGDLAREQQDVRDRILLDQPPKGIEYFDLIVDAFREGYALQMEYKKFYDSEPYSCFIEPYCLKHDHQRWYLLARKDHRSYLQTFALDRIVSLTEKRDCPFRPDPDFSPRLHFEHSFGVFVGTQLPVNIRIRAYGVGRDYLRTAPLHPSQKEKVYSDEASDFTLYCRTTRDLLLHLLSQGSDVEVLEPAGFRKEIEAEAKKIAERYSGRAR